MHTSQQAHTRTHTHTHTYAHALTYSLTHSRTRTHALIGADFSVSRGHALTALAFADDGLNVCVGTHSGHVLQYDLRSSRPLLHKRHQYELPVHSLAYHK